MSPHKQEPFLSHRIEVSQAATAFAASQVRRFARTHWWLLARFAALSGLRVVTTFAAILLIRDFLTGVLAEPSGLSARLTASVGQATALWIVGGLLLAVFIASAVFAYGSQLTMQRLIRLLELDLMQRLITHLLQLPVAFFDGRKRGDLVESFRQDVTKTRAAAAAMIEMLVYGAQGAAYMGSALVISPILTAVSLPALLLAAAPGRWFTSQARSRSVRIRRQGYRVTDLLLQLVQGIRIVKVYGGEAAETRNSIATARKYFDHLIGAARIRALADVVVESAAGLGVVALILVGGFEVIADRLTVPSLVALLIAVRAAHGPLHNCFNRFMEIQANWASLERFRQLLDTPPEPPDPPNAPPFTEPIASIEFRDVSFGYDADGPVLSGISFTVQAGQRVGVVGPSGAGKTTLMSLLPRLYDPTGGRILLNGRDLRDCPRRDVRRRMAIVTQDQYVFGTTVRDNIRYGRMEASDADIERAAKAAEIHDDIVKLPQQYDTVIGVGGRLLSAGQLQRINIARALLKDAPIVILDEATSNLDSISESRIQDALERLMVGCTTFSIAHRLSTLRNADVILVLHEGRCVAKGTHASLIQTCDLYRRLWQAQQTSADALSPARADEAYDLFLGRAQR